MEFKDNKSKILFKIELQYDITTCCFLNKNILLFGTRDFKIVLLNVKREYELFINRQNMVEEEKLSATFNVYVNNKNRWQFERQVDQFRRQIILMKKF